jgi:hypothetical protein
MRLGHGPLVMSCLEQRAAGSSASTITAPGFSARRFFRKDPVAELDALIADVDAGPAISFFVSSLFLPQKLQRKRLGRIISFLSRFQWNKRMMAPLLGWSTSRSGWGAASLYPFRRALGSLGDNTSRVLRVFTVLRPRLRPAPPF